MGYRSDVLIAVAFRDNAHRDEVWAVYIMDPRVKEHGLAAVWRNYDNGEYPVLYYQQDYVKWYESYDDVQGISHLVDVASDFAQEREMHYAAVSLRIGEDTTDIESNDRYTNNDMMSFLWDLCRVERSITHNFE